jgi:two-component system OmpR family response regulator
MKVLLIDDNTEITEMLSQYLTLKKCDCTIINNGRDGLDQILSKKHDVIILDIAMPDFSGIDLINSLEKKGKLKEHKIIVLTASSVTDEELANILDKGVVTALKKPVDLNRLFEVVRICSQLKAPYNAK